MYAGTTALFWGFLAIFIKVTLNDDVPPVVVVWFRFSVAFAFLFSYFSIKDRSKLTILRRPPWLLIVAAICLTLNYIGYAYGIHFTSPGNAQIFIQMGPILLAVSGIVIFKEKLSVRQAVGFGIAGAGFAFFYRDQLANLLGNPDHYNTGVLWVAMAAITWTTYAVLQKKLVQSFHAQQLNLIIFGLPMILLMPFVDFSLFADFGPKLWGLLLFLGLNTIVAYGCLAESFKYIEANKISVIITLNPIITLIAMSVLAWMQVSWIDAEVITVIGLIGALLVLAGAVMVVIPKRKNRA